MPDVISLAPADARLFVALDVHELSIVAATLPPKGGEPELTKIETTEKAIRRFINKLGRARGPGGLLRGGAGRVRSVATADIDGCGV